MVNLKLLSRFIARVLVVVLPVLGIVFGCSLVSILLAEEIQAFDRLGTWQFWTAAGLGVLMAALALAAAYVLAGRWVQAVYGLPNLKEGRGFVERQLFGLRGFAPWFRVEGGVPSESETHILRKVGGPGNLVISLDSAVLTEEAGILNRVLDAGNKTLTEFERVYAVLDLRPRRHVVSVSGMSYEGIPVICDLQVHCQLAQRPTERTDGASAADKAMDEWKRKLFQSATSSWVRESYHEQQLLDWGDRLAGVGMGSLRDQMARHRLDELVGLVDLWRTGNTVHAYSARTRIRNTVRQAMRLEAPRLGVRLFRVEISDIRVTDAITQQWVERCKAHWTRRTAESQILGKAQHVALVETARNDATMLLLKAAIGAVQGLTADERQITSKLVLSRLFMVLSSGPGGDSLTRVYLPREAVNTLNEVKKLLL